MKLNELINSLSDNEYVQEAVYEVSDAIFLDKLLDTRQRFINDYEAVKDGQSRSIFVLNDLEEDAFQISRRIESADMLIAEFKADHEPFDFESVEWWDDKEGLNE